jgi:peptide/nickel transport system substrate-binding protein
VDKLLVEARSLTSETERAEKYNAFQNILVEDVPAIFLYSPSYTYIHNKKINNFSGSSIITSSDRFSQISDWYIKTKKTWAR